MLYPKIRQKSLMFRVNKGPILSVGWQERWDNFDSRNSAFDLYFQFKADALLSLLPDLLLFPSLKNSQHINSKAFIFFSSLELKTPIVYSAPGHPDTDLFITTYYLVFLSLWILGIALMPVTSWFDLCNELLSLQIRCKRDRKFQKRNIPHLHGIVFYRKKNLLQHFVLLITQ